MHNFLETAKYLFLDRDGVINTRPINNYVKSVSEFTFEFKVLEACKILSEQFEKIFVVTNQQGVGKGLMTESQLLDVHFFMGNEIVNAGGKLDGIFYCPHLHSEKCLCRKPNIGLALQARKLFPGIQFSKSVMVGDTQNDMFFGKKLNMNTVLIGNDVILPRNCPELVDFQFNNLYEFALFVRDKKTNQASFR